MSRARTLLTLLVLAGLVVGAFPGSLGAQGQAVPEDPVVVRLYYKDQAQLDAVAGQLDVWEVHRAERYAVAAVTPDQYRWLEGLGYALEVDREKTALLGIHAPLDPRYYYFDDDYTNPNGNYLVDFLQVTNSAYPGITELVDIGNAWQGDHGGHLRDMWVLRISNEDPAFGPISSKPPFFIMGEIHAREVTAPEMAVRYIRYMTSGYNGQGGYGVDPDVTWLVDWNVVYVLPMQNPDGHRVNEADTSIWWRKNVDNDDGCSDPDSWGVDLNRNHSFLWGCCGGSTPFPCDQTYRGPSRGTEPETAAFEDYFVTVVPDQNGPNGDDEVPPAAPITTTGIFLSLHSYSDEILWPWYLPGIPDPPDFQRLIDLGRKLAYLSTYYPAGTVGYTVDGSANYWAYGKTGVPAYTVEIGPSGGSCGNFFPAYDCMDGINGYPQNFWAENRPMLLYMHKIARTPYMSTYGPDAQNLSVSPNPVPQGTPVDLSALLQDHRYGGDPLAPVGAGEYFIDEPGADGTGFAMAPQDGSWGGTSETAIATVDTSGLSVGRHYILVHGKKATTPNDYWGPFSAIFLDVLPGGPCDGVQILDVVTQTDGCAVAFSAVLSGTAPFTYEWDFGPFGSSGEPTPTVPFGLPGTYAYTLTVSNCYGQDTDVFQGSVTVDCCVPPSDTAFTYAPPDPLNGETVVFSATASGSDPLSYDWAFGDGATGSGAVVTHSYADGGDYSVVLTASNDCGDQSVSQTVSVCQAVEGAAYTWTPMAPRVGDLVSFHGLASGSAPITYAWAFGDGTSGSGQDVTHTYAAPDTYTIVLTATNCGGAFSVITGTLTVQPPPCDAVHDVAFDWRPATPTVGEVVAFTGTATGTLPISFSWGFGDGGLAGGITATHAYTVAGTYTVTLAAENCGGMTRTVSHPVAVVPPGCDLVSVITVTPEMAGCTVAFTTELTGTAPFTYLWAFGDGLTSTLAVVTHTYAQTGPYSGTLDVWNCDGAGHDTFPFNVQVDCTVPRVWYVYLPVVFK